MTLAADRLWSAEQQGWLRALGLTVFLPADWPTEAGAPSRAATEAVSERPEREAPPSPVRARPPVPEVIERTPPVRPASPARMPGSRMPDRLHFALIRASGMNPNAPGAAEVFAQWPSSAELRGNPAAKRALWPVLRRLRRSAP